MMEEGRMSSTKSDLRAIVIKAAGKNSLLLWLDDFVQGDPFSRTTYKYDYFNVLKIKVEYRDPSFGFCILVIA